MYQLSFYAEKLAVYGSFQFIQIDGLIQDYLDGLVQERHNSTANALQLRLSCSNPSIWWINIGDTAVLYWAIDIP